MFVVVLMLLCTPLFNQLAIKSLRIDVIDIYINQHFGLNQDAMPCVLYLNSKTQWDKYRYLTACLNRIKKSTLLG